MGAVEAQGDGAFLSGPFLQSLGEEIRDKEFRFKALWFPLDIPGQVGAGLNDEPVLADASVQKGLAVAPFFNGCLGCEDEGRCSGIFFEFGPDHFHAGLDDSNDGGFSGSCRAMGQKDGERVAGHQDRIGLIALVHGFESVVKDGDFFFS